MSVAGLLACWFDILFGKGRQRVAFLIELLTNIHTHTGKRFMVGRLSLIPMHAGPNPVVGRESLGMRHAKKLHKKKILLCPLRYNLRGKIILRTVCILWQKGYGWRKLLYLPYSETVCVSAKRKCSIGTGNNWTLTLIIYKILIYTSTGQTYLIIYFFLFLGGGGGGCSHWTLLVPRPFLPPLFDHLQFAKTERWVIDQIMEAVKAREHDCDELSFSQPPPLE